MHLNDVADTRLIHGLVKEEGLFDSLLSVSAQLHLGDKLAYAHQVHSKRVFIVDSPGITSRCDGLITKNAQITLAIQVADCIPLYIAEKTGKLVGLVHAGWRGSVLGVSYEAIMIMRRKFNIHTSDIFTFLGPSIRSCCYEVGSEVAKHFPDHHLIEKGENKYSLDLIGVNLDQLKIAGIKNNNISIDKRCTYCSTDGLHSFRRDEEFAGRNICFISGRGTNCASA